jgi:hypothetical protein
MKTRQTYSNCDKCNKVIHYQEQHISINKYIEFADNSTSRIETEVIDALQILTLCEPCGKEFDEHFSKLKREFLE